MTRPEYRLVLPHNFIVPIMKSVIVLIVCLFLFQPPSSILAQVQLLNAVPIHTISFNCADTEANQFLCQLAAETGGR